MATEHEAVPVELDVTDAALFDGAVADEAPAEVIDEPEKPAEPVQLRDEQGKFAAKEEKAAAVAVEAKTNDDDKTGHVPSWRVREINAEKAELARKLEAETAERTRTNSELEAMRRQLASLQKPVEQPKQEKPDPLIDPEGYEKYIEQKFEARFLNDRRETSLSNAHRTYKQDFEEAYASAQQAMVKGDVALAAKMQQSRDPGETLMQWHREEKTKREVGNDPNAWLEKKLEERLADPAFLAKAIEKARGVASAVPANGRPSVQLPPSLSSLTRADDTQTSADDSDLSDAALFKQALR